MTPNKTTLLNSQDTNESTQSMRHNRQIETNIYEKVWR